MSITTISSASYAVERAICDRAAATLERLWPDHAQGGAIPADVTQHLDWQACNNDMRGRVEQYKLIHNTPDRLTCYLDSNLRPCVWTGRLLSTQPAHVASRWRVNSHVGSHMHQFYVWIAGRQFTGRSFGAGWCINLTETAESKGKRALEAA